MERRRLRLLGGGVLSKEALDDPECLCPRNPVCRSSHLSVYPPLPGPIGPTLGGLGVAPPGGLVSVRRIDRPLGGLGRKPGSACLM